VKASELLREAAKKLEGHWTRFVEARDENGLMVHPCSPDAACWCSYGVINSLTFNNYAAGAAAKVYVWLAITGKLGITKIAAWQDEPGRTEAEVLDAFRRAAELAEAQGE
jgi:hypothetical protein